MFRHLTVATLASTFLLGASLPALSQQACAPEKLSAAIDTYAKAPFSARTWRVLNGLGDPGIGGETLYSYDNWQERGQWKDLVTSLVPEAKELAEPGYSCRLSYPLATLRAHLVSLPLKDPYIKQWLVAQATVFKACTDSNAQALTLPPALDVKGELAALQTTDRAYQEASIKFYSEPSKAVELFKAIGSSASPHKAAARYNVANLLANAHNVVEARKEADAILADASLSSVHEITKDLLGYIANVEDTPAGWQRLIDDNIAILTQPTNVITKDENSKRRYANGLFDIEFGGIKAKADDWWIVGKLPENPTLSKAIADSARKQPMALWMMAGQTIEQNLSRAPWSLVGPKWHAWNTSFVDRAMALQPAANGINPLARSLINGLASANDDLTRATLWSSVKDAAGKAQSSCGEAPETAAVGELAIQATRLSAEAGRFDEIYANLSSLPLENSETLNALILPKLREHFLTTGNVEEGRRFRDKFLSDSKMTELTRTDPHAQRDASSDFLQWVAEDKARWQSAAAFHSDKLSSVLINFLPSKELMSHANDPSFNAEQKARLSRTAWTRDFARSGKLSKRDVEGLVEWTRNFAPSGKPDTRGLVGMLLDNPQIIAAYEKAKEDYPTALPEHAFTLTMLRNPRFNMLVTSPDPLWGNGNSSEKFDELNYYDHNDMNWWCPFETDRMLGAVRSNYDQLSGMAAVKDWNADKLKPLLEADAVAKADAARDQLLKNHPIVKIIDWKELASLAKAPSAPKALTLAAMAWAKRSDGKDGAPEALALAVRATRYGCNWHGSHKAYSKPTQEMLQAKFGTTEWATKTPYWFDCQFKQYDKDGNELKTCKPKQWPKQAPLK